MVGSPSASRRLVWPWVAGGVALVTVACLGGCAVLLGRMAKRVDAAANRPHEVVYEVIGEGTARSITYASTDGGGFEQVTQVTLPWKKETISRGPATHRLVARNDDDGSITCRITIDGTVVTEKTSSGPYAVVACRASTKDAGKRR